MGKAPALVRSSVVLLPRKSGLMVTEAITGVGSLIHNKRDPRTLWLQTIEAQVAVFYTQKPGEHSHYNEWPCWESSQGPDFEKVMEMVKRWGHPKGQSIRAPVWALVYLNNEKELRMTIRRLRAVIPIKLEPSVCPVVRPRPHQLKQRVIQREALAASWQTHGCVFFRPFPKRPAAVIRL